MDANELKTKLLYYWRFDKNYHFCGTEVGVYNADILVSNESEIIEIEVKVSLADLKQEFTKRKHQVYQSPSTRQKHFLPQKYFIAVPTKLVDAALTLVTDKPYGVIEVYDAPITFRKRVKYCRIRKSAKVIYPTFNAKLHRQLVMRMTSELVRTRLRLHIQK